MKWKILIPVCVFDSNHTLKQICFMLRLEVTWWYYMPYFPTCVRFVKPNSGWVQEFDSTLDNWNYFHIQIVGPLIYYYFQKIHHQTSIYVSHSYLTPFSQHFQTPGSPLTQLTRHKFIRRLCNHSHMTVKPIPTTVYDSTTTTTISKCRHLHLRPPAHFQIRPSSTTQSTHY